MNKRNLTTLLILIINSAAFGQTDKIGIEKEEWKTFEKDGFSID